MQNKFILLVEDDPDDVVLISRAVRKNSIWADIEVAGDGVEALGTHRVARRLTGFEWGHSETSAATSAPWLDASAALRNALGPTRK